MCNQYDCERAFFSNLWLCAGWLNIALYRSITIYLACLDYQIFQGDFFKLIRLLHHFALILYTIIRPLIIITAKKNTSPINIETPLDKCTEYLHLI